MAFTNRKQLVYTRHVPRNGKVEDELDFHHFTIETVADGVYAAIASSNGAAGSNSGIIDLGDQTIIFDTFATVSAAKELRKAAEVLTGRSAGYVINSHSHPDHVHGNVVFADDFVLISSSKTRSEIELHGIEGMNQMHTDLTVRAESYREQLKTEAEESNRIELEEAIRFFDNVLAGYPTPDDLRLPAVTYENSLSFYGKSREVHLHTFGGAHSACDAVLWLPDEKILFVGDLVIPGGGLIVSLGHPENWLEIIDRLEAFGANTMIPGHGPVLEANEGYESARQTLNRLFQMADEAVLSGEFLDYAERVDVPEGLSEYWFRKDIRFLIEQRMKQLDS